MSKKFQFTENNVKMIESIKNVCSLQASTLKICASIVLSRRIFKVKYSHQSKKTLTKNKN